LKDAMPAATASPIWAMMPSATAPRMVQWKA
jgi:hypothetical protein